jgi:hypothetical protein
MGISVKARHLPQRIAAGAFILNSGIGKLSVDDEGAGQLHGFAAGAYLVLQKLKPNDFVRLLAAAEIGLGVALLVPAVPSAIAKDVWLAGIGVGLVIDDLTD